MPIPTYQVLMLPLLKICSDDEEHSARALTRGSRSLTVFSESPELWPGSDERSG